MKVSFNKLLLIRRNILQKQTPPLPKRLAKQQRAQQRASVRDGAVLMRIENPQQDLIPLLSLISGEPVPRAKHNDRLDVARGGQDLEPTVWGRDAAQIVWLAFRESGVVREHIIGVVVGRVVEGKIREGPETV